MLCDQSHLKGSLGVIGRISLEPVIAI